MNERSNRSDQSIHIKWVSSSSIELARLVGLLVALLLSLLRLQLDQVINAQDGDGSLGGELQALHLNMMKQWNY